MSLLNVLLIYTQPDWKNLLLALDMLPHENTHFEISPLLSQKIFTYNEYTTSRRLKALLY